TSTTRRARGGVRLGVFPHSTWCAQPPPPRRGFAGGAKPDAAIPLYEKFMAHCRERGFTVEHGEFGAKMEVDSLNHGPVTILFDTEK
ncbi:MAG: D-aminoacyl-tRNA deacylase, partial [Dysosmobacter sp.]|nr:D-aminoacyl-tRNA deacylase [Dysosmobacter sp.]